jgi:glycosyltransferase involved in cell wall biosynthesis
MTAELGAFEARVVAPVPYFPPIRCFKRWYRWSQFPREETVDGLRVIRPRYAMLPGIGGRFESALMYPSVRRAVERIRRDFDFDLIDAHWVYPAGVVGARLAQRYGKPLVVTGRGADMHLGPRIPAVARHIRRALGAASHCIALSTEIARAMKSNGAPADRVSVIPNGVDCDAFRPLPKAEARTRLGLPADAKIVLSVGDFFENKGFHLLIDAIPAIRRRHPNAFVALVGGAPGHGTDYTGFVNDRVAANGLESRVLLAGRRPQEELVWWYNAADVFALLSAREGSPNVLLEALACGTPAVATAVGGIAAELEDSQRGILLSERSAEAAAVGIADGLGRPWDRPYIRRSMERRSWQSTAENVCEVFDRALRSTRAKP